MTKETKPNSSVGVPSKEKALNRAFTGIKAGTIGGVGVSLGVATLGPVLGPLVGGSIAAAMLPKGEGDIVAINAVMDSVEMMFLGGN